MWLLSTATPCGAFTPVTRVVTPVPSRLASSIVPSPKLAQYRWGRSAPVPVSGSVAVAVDLMLTAVSVAVSVPVLDGANCTVTVQDLPGPRLVPVQVSVVIANATGPDSATVSARAAVPPVLASVSVCDAVCPVVTVPKSSGVGVKANTGPVLAAAGHAVPPSPAPAPP